MKDIVELLQELKGEFGSKGGGRKSAVAGGTDTSRSADKAQAEKGRVTVYQSIDDALHKGHYGQIFSTTGSERLYVITQKKWGKSGQQTVGNKTAKGFSKGSIPSSFGDVKTFAIRTLQRHGGRKEKRLAQREKELSGQVDEAKVDEGSRSENSLARKVFRNPKAKLKKGKTSKSSASEKSINTAGDSQLARRKKDDRGGTGSINNNIRLNKPDNPAYYKES